jgi:hypothetical protein
MALTLDCTISSTSNAYVSLATCELFLSESIYTSSSSWATLSTSSKEACIIFATSLLDAQIDWIGEKANDDDTQRLRWPRSSAYTEDGYAIDDDIIPTPIQRGTSFFAFYLSQSDRTLESDTFGFKQLEAGSLNMVIDKYDRKPVMPNIVWDILKAYGRKAVGRARVLERR